MQWSFWGWVLGGGYIKRVEKKKRGEEETGGGRTDVCTEQLRGIGECYGAVVVVFWVGVLADEVLMRGVSGVMVMGRGGGGEGKRTRQCIWW